MRNLFEIKPPVNETLYRLSLTRSNIDKEMFELIEKEICEILASYDTEFFLGYNGRICPLSISDTLEYVDCIYINDENELMVQTEINEYSFTELSLEEAYGVLNQLNATIEDINNPSN